MYSELLLEKIRRGERIIIELGCGPNQNKDIIGVDVVPQEGVDIVADLEDGLKFIPDACIDEIRSRHFLEHINNFDLMMQEIHRVLKPTGLHKTIVPHFSNPHYYSDYTHKRFFGLYSFDYFADEDSKLKRKVPSFYASYKFHVVKRKLNFKSPFFVRNYIKRPFRFIFNISAYMQEFYEEIFSSTISCQEIYFEMYPVKLQKEDEA